MLDIKLIRENPEKINELLKRRNPDLSIDEVLKIDEERRKVQFELDNLRATRKAESNKIGAMKKQGIDTTEIQAEIRKLGEDSKALEEKLAELDNKQRDTLLRIPNTPDETAESRRHMPSTSAKTFRHPDENARTAALKCHNSRERRPFPPP